MRTLRGCKLNVPVVTVVVPCFPSLIIPVHFASPAIERARRHLFFDAHDYLGGLYLLYTTSMEIYFGGKYKLEEEIGYGGCGTSCFIVETRAFRRLFLYAQISRASMLTASILDGRDRVYGRA